jgi:thiamine pyrophosphokinase
MDLNTKTRLHIFGPLQSLLMVSYSNYFSFLKSFEEDNSFYNEKVIFVDGGMQYAKLFSLSESLDQMDISDYFWIGDGDSHLGEVTLNPDKTHHLSKDKDQSDLAMAFQNLIPVEENIHQIFLHGFLGGRLDHQLAVFGELFKWHQILSPGVMILFDADIKRKIELFKGEHTTQHNGTFSLFSLVKQNILLSGDLKYAGEDIPLFPLQSHGLSNEGFGPFHIISEEVIMLIRE